MTSHTLRSALLALLAITLISGCDGNARAQGDNAASGIERTGSVTGRIGAASIDTHTLKMVFDGAVRATANFGSPVGFMTEFTIQGHTGTSFAIKDSVSVTFSISNGQLVAGGVLYLPEEGMFPHYVDHNDSVQVTLDVFEDNGDTAIVKGTATGTIYRLTGYTGEPDAADALEVDLTFEATAYRE